MEEKSIADGAPRVKFGVEYQGTITDLLDKADEDQRKRFDKISKNLSSALSELEECGATPVCGDGKVAGNAAAVWGEKHWLIVSKSGKLGGKAMDPLTDVCIVTRFDKDEWKAFYYAECKDTVPTSDAPLHVSALLDAPLQYGWDHAPTAAVHGHALETADEADKLGLPCSHDETLFSTPADSQALVELMGEYTYPKHNVYIRKGHGFIAIGKGVDGAMKNFREKVKPHITTSTDDEK